MSIPQPLPRVEAFEKMGFGLFLHWGLYSQLGTGEWSQFIHKISIPEYRKLAAAFTACDFDPEDWAMTAREAGMKYIVLTTRHHDGFSLWEYWQAPFPPICSRRPWSQEKRNPPDTHSK